ncbi:MAG: pyridoxal 5'-phosphate synthase glutaminase subunit PdxT [Thermoplasmataceae archaeon]
MNWVDKTFNLYLKSSMVKIGIIGFQGDVQEHLEMFHRISERGKNISIELIRKEKALDNIDGLVIPGGESTTIYKLIKEYNIYDKIKEKFKEGFPVMGTCAGLIIISKNTNDPRVEGMGLLDSEILRNGYGRQGESFIDNVNVEGIGTFKGVFIRAPIIKNIGNSKVLAFYKNLPVLIHSRYALGMTFHPELTEDIRIHEMFLQMIGGEGYISTGEKIEVIGK